jgi:hypothetical protein
MKSVFDMYSDISTIELTANVSRHQLGLEDFEPAMDLYDALEDDLELFWQNLYNKCKSTFGIRLSTARTNEYFLAEIDRYDLPFMLDIEPEKGEFLSEYMFSNHCDLIDRINENICKLAEILYEKEFERKN